VIENKVYLDHWFLLYCCHCLATSARFTVLRKQPSGASERRRTPADHSRVV